MSKDNGGSAFPVSIATDSTGGIWNSHAIEDGCGMTLRDYFAISALPIAWDALDKGYFDSDDHNADLSKAAYQMADAMLKARGE